MITDEFNVQYTSHVLQHIATRHGARPLDDRQAEALAIYVNEMQGKLDDLNDKCDELEEKLDA